MNLLAFDLGAESGRAVLGTLDGRRLRIEELHRFANEPLREGRQLRWNFPALWDDVRLGLKRAESRPTLDGVGVDTWGVDYGLVDGDGQLVCSPIHYRDARTDGVMDEVVARVGRERLYGATGVQFLPFNTLFQLVAHARTDPDSLRRAHRLLFMPDLFALMLSGEQRTEPTIASTSQMYDPLRHDWARELLAELQIPFELLPAIVPTGSALRPDAPVIAVGHDTAAAVVAVPAGESANWCYISSGTWSLMGVERSEPIINADSLRHNFTNEVGFGRSIRFLRNIMGLWLVQESRREFARSGREFTYGELTALAAGAECEAVIDPDHKPFLSPGEMPAKIERFCRDSNQPAPADPGQIVRCCLESLALRYRRTLEHLEELTGQQIETIHIVGGGSQNELLNQMTADACARTVVAGPAEATAIGNLLVQAISVGAVASLAEARRIVRESFDVKRFEPREPAAWDAKHARFREVAGR